MSMLAQIHLGWHKYLPLKCQAFLRKLKSKQRNPFVIFQIRFNVTISVDFIRFYLCVKYTKPWLASLAFLLKQHCRKEVKKSNQIARFPVLLILSLSPTNEHV